MTFEELLPHVRKGKRFYLLYEETIKHIENDATLYLEDYIKVYTPDHYFYYITFTYQDLMSDNWFILEQDID